MRIFLALVLAVAMTAAAFSATLDVPAAYPTIQAAIDGAQHYDTVMVAPGTYVENLNFNGKNIRVTSAEGPEKTVIDGNQAGCVIRFESNETTDAVIEGFHITNGYAYSGAGICCTYASATIQHNIIAGNYAYNSGGGFSCWYSSSILRHNRVYNNVAEWSGGGFNIKFSDTQVHNNTVYSNSAGKRGGGVRFAGGTFDMGHNVIFLNWARYGGGVTIGCDPPSILVNNLVYMNQATDYGGGIHATGPFPVNSNNTVYGNSAALGGGGLFFGYDATADLRNMILWGNTAPQGPEVWVGTTAEPSFISIRHSDLQGGLSSVYRDLGCAFQWGAGMIDDDPLFVDPAKGDLHLLYASPCREGGDSSAPGLPDLDFEGDPRTAHSNVDMGGDEFYTHLYFTGDATPGGMVELNILGDPASAPVLLWLGSGVLDPPLATGYGDFHLQFPLLLQLGLGAIPLSGRLHLPAQLPLNLPVPTDLALQSFAGSILTNLCVMPVR